MTNIKRFLTLLLIASISVCTWSADPVTIVSWTGASRTANQTYAPTNSQSDNSSARLKSECGLTTAGTGGCAGSYYGSWTNGKCIYITGLSLTNYADISLDISLRRRYTPCSATFYVSTNGSTYSTTALDTKSITNSCVNYSVSSIGSSVQAIKIVIDGASGNLWLGDVTLTGTAASTCTNTPTMSFTNTSVDKTTDDASYTQTVNISGKGAGQTVAYSSSDETIGTVNTSGVVTLKGKVGSTTITASVEASGTYCSASASYTINVTKAPINVTLYYKGTSTILEDQTTPYTLPTTGEYVANACDAWTFDGWYGSSYAKSTTKPTSYITELTTSGNAYAVYKHTEGGSSPEIHNFSNSDSYTSPTPITTGVTIAFSKGNNTSSSPYWDGSAVRVYYKNTMTITSTGDPLTRIEFTQTSGTNTISVNTGTISGLVWTGNASSVTFTLGGTSGHRKITSVSIGGGGTTYYSTEAECGPKVQATASPWVTSTNGQFVKVEVPVTATNFDKNSTLSAIVSGAGFSIVDWGANGNAVTKDEDLTTSLILVYNPTEYNTTADATITFSSDYNGSQTPVYTDGIVHGRSLPEKFVIAIKNGDQWYALPANMSGSGTYAGEVVSVDDINNPTKVTAGPATALYGLLGVASSRYSDYGTRVRFLGNEKCLWSNAANDGTGINNGAVPASATSDHYEWTLATTDGITYAINTNVAKKIEEGRELRYYAGESRFGMYTSGNNTFRFLPVDCDNRATVTATATTYNSITLTWTGKSGTDYNVYIDEGGVTQKTETNVTSPVTISGLSSETNYTWIISPGDKDNDCALSGDFTTNVAPINVTLSCDGTEYHLGPQDKPYTLPTSGVYVNDACTEWTFEGWTTNTHSKSTSKPTLIDQVSTDGTVYAVYKNTEGGGGSGSLTLTGAQTTGGGYNTSYSVTEYTSENDAVTIASNNIINNNTYIQLKAGAGNRIYNTTAIPGAITQITVTATTNSAYVYVGSSSVGSGSTVLEPTSGSRSGTAVYTIPADNTYFAVGATSNYVVVSDIEVLYSSSTSYYATSSECCNEVAVPTVVVEPVDVSATISWDNQSGAVNGYNVTCTNGTNQDVAAGVTSLVISGLSASTSYDYTVTAKGATCNRTFEGSFTTSSCSDVPTDVIVTPGTHTANIRWTASAATATIVIYDDEQGTSIVTSVANQTSPCTISGLNDNTNYYLQVLAGGSCPLPTLKPFTTQSTAVSIAEWRPDGININLNADEATATVLIEDKQEKTASSTSYADSIFISKYFEADGENKLLAIFNGTTDTIPLSNYCLKRSARYASTPIPTVPTNVLTLELGSYGRIKPGYIAPNEEIIFIRYAQNAAGSAEPCASEQEGYENWYVFENSSSEGNFLNFSGPMSIGLYSKTADKFIDVIGATTNANGQGYLCQINASNNQPCPAATKSFNDMAGFYTLTGDNHQTEEVETDYGLSTNRCLLIRKNTVKSGMNAVASNVFGTTWQDCSTDIAEAFTTLSSEWTGLQVGPGTSSGETHSNTCIGMGYVGGFDYNSYYAHYDSLTTVQELGGKLNKDGTYTISIPQLDTLSCTMLRVKVYEGTEEKASAEYKVPIMVEGSKMTNDEVFKKHEVPTCKECDVVILKDAILEKTNGVNDRDEVRNLTIYPGGKLVVPSDKGDYTVQSVQFRVEKENAPLAKLIGNLITKDQQVIVSRRIKNDRYYFFSLPYDCNIADIHWANGEPATIGVDYQIVEYDGARRANEGSGSGVTPHWTPVSGTQLKAGVGYNIAVSSSLVKELIFPMAIGGTNLTNIENTKTAKTVAIHQYTNAGTTINNHNWNLVAHPYVSAFEPYEGDTITAGILEYTEPASPGEQGTWELTNTNKVYLTMPSFNNNAITYTQTLAGDITSIDPFLAVFVQGAGDGYLTFEQTGRKLSAPARHLAAAAEDEDESIFVGVTLSGNGESDQTCVRIRPDFTDEYQLGYDLDKFVTFYTSRPQVYMKTPSYRLAFQAVSDEVAKSTFLPMGVYCYQAGTYTFALNDRFPTDEVEAVYLFDKQTGVTTNLLYDTYSFSATKQVYTNTRFSLNVIVNRRAPQTATGMENAHAPNEVVRKILINGHVYIQRGGVIYDVTGKQMLNHK